MPDNFIKTLAEYGIIDLDDSIEEGFEKLRIFMAKLKGIDVLDGNDLMEVK